MGLLSSGQISDNAAFPLLHKSMYLPGLAVLKATMIMAVGEVIFQATLHSHVLALTTCVREYLGTPLYRNLKENNRYPVDFSSSKWDFIFFAQWPNPYRYLSQKLGFPFLIPPIASSGFFFSAWYTISTGPVCRPSFPTGLQLPLLLVWPGPPMGLRAYDLHLLKHSPTVYYWVGGWV